MTVLHQCLLTAAAAAQVLYSVFKALSVISTHQLMPQLWPYGCLSQLEASQVTT